MDEKRCNPLVAVIVFLVATIVVILGALIVMRLRAEPTETVRTVEKLVMPRRNETETKTTTSTSTSRMTTTSKPVTASTKASRNVCESPECITLAHQMNNWMDPKVDPCNDFFEYACGKYAEHSDTDRNRVHGKNYIVNGLIKEFLLKNKPTDSLPEKTMHLFYRKCKRLQDDSNKDEESVSINKEIFKNMRKIGSWPTIDANWDPKKFDLSELLSNKATLTSKLGFFDLVVSPEYKITMAFSGRASPLTAEDLLKQIESLLTTNQISFDASILEKDIGDYFQLQQRMEKLDEMGTTTKTFDELKAAVPSIDFVKIIEKLGNLKGDEFPRVKKRIAVQESPLFFANGTNNMESVIKTTDPRVLANYVMFQFFDIAYSVFFFGNKGVKCDELMKAMIPKAVYQMFTNNYFDEENLKAAAEIVNRTELSYVEMFRESKWLSESTRKAAIQKVQNLKRTIGHTDDYGPKIVDERYRKLNFQDTDTLYTIINKEWHLRDEESLKYIGSGAELAPQESQLETNAVYYPELNRLYFLSAYLDDPFFDVTLPFHAKMAHVGRITAHEIGHAFDPEGMMFDEFGNVGSKWDQKDKEEYEKRTQCLRDLTNNYDDPVYGRTLNGDDLIKEVIADAIAVKVSWKTLKKGGSNNEPRIIGFEDQSNGRSFFHIMALNHCIPRLEPTMIPMTHPPGNFRINAIYSNSKAFAEAYQCPIGSPMNPEKNVGADKVQYKGIQTILSIITLDLCDVEASNAKPSMTGQVDLSFHVSVPADTSQKPEIQTKKEPKKSCNPLVSVVLILILIFGAMILMRLNTEKHLDTVSISPETPINQKPDMVWSRNVCESPTCLTLAHQMNNWRDPKVDPCDNFFEYACGKYTEHTDTNGPRRNEKEYIVIGLVKEFLLKNKPTDSPSEKAMHLFYQKCLQARNNSTRQLESKKIYRQLFDDIRKVGPWPTIDSSWDSEKFDLNEMLSNLVSPSGNFGLFRVTNEPINRILIDFERRSANFSQEKLFNAVTSVLDLNQVAYNQSIIKNDIVEYFELQNRLESLDAVAEKFLWLSHYDHKSIIPSIDFDRIIKIMGNLNDDELMNVKKRTLVLLQPIFYDRSENLESIINSTQPRVLANYLMFHLFEVWYKPIQGLETLTAECHQIVAGTMPQATYRFFMNHHFDEQNLLSISRIINETTDSYIEMFKESTWLSGRTRNATIRKVEQVLGFAGHTPEFEQEIVEDKYRTLNLQPSDTIYSILQKGERFQLQQYLSFVAAGIETAPKPIILTTNAQYMRMFNKFHFFSPYLDEPFYDSTLPSYAKLAVVGFITGHEVGHGFDPRGFKYDGLGNLGNQWDEKDTEEYERRTQCLINMTEEYEVPVYGRVLDGELTKGEVTADVLGVDVTWRMFKKGEYTNEPRMIGFEDQSIEKTFFHLMALDYCSPTMKPRVDPHPPGNFRVNAIYSNSKAFAEAYQCPIGSPMNPEKKCELF